MRCARKVAIGIAAAAALTALLVSCAGCSQQDQIVQPPKSSAPPELKGPSAKAIQAAQMAGHVVGKRPARGW